MLTQLKALIGPSQLRLLDYHFAQFIAQSQAHPVSVVCAALTSYELGRGNVCLDLASLDAYFAADGLLAEWSFPHEQLPEPSSWPTFLTQCHAVGEGKPLQLQRNRLYLTRYCLFEQAVAARLLQSSAPPEAESLVTLGEQLNSLFAPDWFFVARQLHADLNNPDNARAFATQYLDVVHPALVNWGEVSQCLLQAYESTDAVALLPQVMAYIPSHAQLNWQKVAAALAATSDIAIISGGPGTGKTTTVTKLLALLLMQSPREPLDIRLAAPTGKAAARLTASITAAVAGLGLAPDISERIPTQASTIHRLLGVIPGRHDFRHHQENLLHLDVLVVDEASMVDLPLMARLLAALPPHCRIILLGDKDQLASVEAGSVLGDICSFSEQGFSQQQAARLCQLTGYELTSASGVASPIADKICQLKRSYRFHQYSGIGYLANAVNHGAVKTIAPLWSQYQDIDLHALSEMATLQHMTVAGYQQYLNLLQPVHSDNADEARAMLNAFNQYQVLVALRQGPYGVEGMNEQVEDWLTQARLIQPALNITPWYPGRPIIITQNDHQAGLYNGDIGICLANKDGANRVYFELADGKVHHFLPSRLPAHQTVYAMTVHKSQGSEFNHTVMVLPDKMAPVLTRELVYTGITRAKTKLDLFSSVALLNQAIIKRTQRASGLVPRLNGAAHE
ncbi:exodeoxyribonuclease V subunit alpha [Motilimonas pumila]|uniref:RecBCD enzyme subunit RecD n=1 Tax=Motilimonas pumila TaxID=2303987 RepID=A0A418YAB8_9GAMM|nr:exodeoxyribonuclease V subunit alpha [Motilimonas pumila]RJG39485.1 exodeoxyribonuclease V subunit alpha [Motilimonas pumila]